METVRRLGIFVYLNYSRDARKLHKFGDVLYSSRRGRYVLVYVKAEQLEDTLAQLASLKFVRDVKVSHLDEIDRQFVGNLLNQ